MMKKQTLSIRSKSSGVVAALAFVHVCAWSQNVSGSTPAVFTSPATSVNTAVTRYDNSLEIFNPVIHTKGMVASEQHLASEVGAEILRQGGNAVDAAVAVGFALAVVLPNAGNLGGGGFMLIHDAKTGASVALDFREIAPAKASRDMYLDANGKVIEGKSTRSPYAVGIPGTVAGLTEALAEHGTMKLSDVIAPAIKLANEGFKVSPFLAELFRVQRTHLERWPSTRSVFFKHVEAQPSCPLAQCPASAIRTYAAGELLIQRDLAQTLEIISAQGAKGFYSGRVAENIVNTLKGSDQPLTLTDLASYKTETRKPVAGQYRGVQILSMPAPSSGGIHLIQMLNLLERYPLKQYGSGSAQSMHLIAESARLAYADRAEHLGDPGFVKVPQSGLISKKYAEQLSSKIDPQRMTPSSQVKAGHPVPYESDQTTHFSVMDIHGNVVSCTYTLNLSFGSGIVAEGTGVLLNNEMDDFSVKPGVPNAFGLVGADANAVAPGKRPLSSMTPVIAFRDSKPWLATGSPGGARIITTVLQNLINIIDFEMNIAEAASVPRMHHQWTPDFIRIERGFSPDTVKILESMGHSVKVMPTMGRIQTVQREGSLFLGASDPRNPDGKSVGIDSIHLNQK